MRTNLAIFFIFPLICSSCSTPRSNPRLGQIPDTRTPPETLARTAATTSRLWESRQQKDSLKAFIDQETVIARSPKRTEQDLIRLSRAEILMSENFAGTESERIRRYESAANWAETALTFNPELRFALLNKKIPTEDLLPRMKKRDAQALYWHALALSKWATLKGTATEIAYRNRIFRMMDRVEALAPGFDQGAVHRFYGTYYASKPGLDEEDLARSRSHFLRALEISPDFPENHVTFSEAYGRKADDLPLRKSHLEAALSGNLKIAGDRLPEQKLEQGRAKKILEGGLE